MQFRLLSAAALLAAAPAAQLDFVLPKGLTNTPAAATTNFPFGNSTPSRIQYVYDAIEVGIASPTPILRLGVRAGSTMTNNAKVGIDLEIGIGSVQTPAAAMTTNFAANRGANHVIAYTRKLTNLPATTPAFVGQYCGPFPFDVPFVFTPGPGTGILIEYDIAQQPSGTWPMDTPFTGNGPHVPNGTGCGGFACTSSGGTVGTSVVFTATGGVPNNPAVLVLGDSDLPAGVPLPGAPGCFLWQNTLAFLNTSIGATNTVVTIPLPQDPTLRGFGLRGQFASIGAQSTLISTNSTRAVLFGQYGVTRIYNNSSNTAATGSIQQFVGIVTKIGI
jgi:hypothetical protein